MQHNTGKTSIHLSPGWTLEGISRELDAIGDPFQFSSITTHHQKLSAHISIQREGPVNAQ